MRPTTTALFPAAIILLVFLVQWRLGLADTIAWGGLSREGLLAGRWWTPLTSPVLHMSLVHAILDAAALVLLGRAVAARLSAPAYGLFLLACGLGGALAYLLLHFDSRELAVGASDVVFGAWGGFARLARQGRGVRPLASRFVALQAALAIAANLALIAVLQLTAGTWAAWAGHLGGFITGLLLIQPLSRGGSRP